MQSLIITLVAACLGQLVTGTPGVLPMKIRKSAQPLPHLRRRDPFAGTLANNYTGGQYQLNVSVGTPPQLVSLQVDTGSSDLWVLSPSAYSSNNCTQNGCFGGSFNPAKSSSNKLIKQGSFNIAYVDQSGVIGDYVSDTVSVDGKSITNLTLGVAQSITQGIQSGIIGVGFDTDESIATSSNQQVIYPNFIDLLVAQKLINSRSYSLYLDDLGDSTGTLLFGGYDTNKYVGELTVLPIQPDAQSGNITSFTVAWTFFGFTTSKGQSRISADSFTSPAVLDSGTSLTTLPTEWFVALAAYFGVTTDGLVKCNLPQGSLDFGFGGANTPQVSVPFSELAIPLPPGPNGRPLTFRDGSPACQFGLQDGGQTGILFGDTFLRSAYVVYDIDAQLVALAPTVFNSGSSNIQPIPAGGADSNPFGTSVTSATAASATQTASRAILGPAATATGTGGVTGVAASATGQPSGASVSYAVKTPGGTPSLPPYGGSATSRGSGAATSSKGAAAGLAQTGASIPLGMAAAVVALFAGGMALGLAI